MEAAFDNQYCVMLVEWESVESYRWWVESPAVLVGVAGEAGPDSNIAEEATSLPPIPMRTVLHSQGRTEAYFYPGEEMMEEEKFGIQFDSTLSDGPQSEHRKFKIFLEDWGMPPELEDEDFSGPPKMRGGLQWAELPSRCLEGCF